MLNVEKNEIMLIYNGEDTDENQTLAYLNSSGNLVLKTLDISREKLTRLQLADILSNSKVSLSKIIHQKRWEEYSAASISGLDEDDLLQILEKHPKLLNTPLTITHKGIDLGENSYDQINKGMKSPAISSKHANEEEKG